jgi:hypothetical protein
VHPTDCTYKAAAAAAAADTRVPRPSAPRRATSTHLNVWLRVPVAAAQEAGLLLLGAVDAAAVAAVPT